MLAAQLHETMRSFFIMPSALLFFSRLRSVTARTSAGISKRSTLLHSKCKRMFTIGNENRFLLCVHERARPLTACTNNKRLFQLCNPLKILTCSVYFYPHLYTPTAYVIATTNSAPKDLTCLPTANEGGPSQTFFHLF